MTVLKVGKVPNDVLKEVIFGRLGVEDPSVVLGPSIGEDAAIIDVDKGFVAFKSDPITGSVDEVGYLSVHVNANDIATRGAVPKWFLQCLLLPEGSSVKDLAEISGQIDQAAKELGISVVGGHTEVTSGINRPIVVGSMIGVAKNRRFFTTSGARPGDALYMTKSVGIEGTAILSSDKRLLSRYGPDFVKRCKALIRQISVVSECLTLADVAGVSSMHDLTEGGLMGGAWEVAEASSSGIHLDLRLAPVIEETMVLCRELALDPYRLISSGSMLFTVCPDHEKDAEHSLDSTGKKFAKIGGVLSASAGRTYTGIDGNRQPLPPVSTDELWRGLQF